MIERLEYGEGGFLHAGMPIRRDPTNYEIPTHPSDLIKINFSQTQDESGDDNAQSISSPKSSSSAVQYDDDNLVTKTNDAQLEFTPKRVTRSSSKSSTTSSPASKSDKRKRTRQEPKKPPLTFFKDPFSPQLTDEQKKTLIELKEAKKGQPRKKYSVTKKVKSKRI